MQNPATQLPPTEDRSSALAVASGSPVRIEARLLSRIGIREWGMPSMCIPGKIWRSEKHQTITCMVPHKDPSKVGIETLPLIVTEDGRASLMPDHWRVALWEYVQAWPSSGCGLGPFLSLTEAQRCDFIRLRAAELVRSDNMGCRHIAHDIGQFAALDCEIIELANTEMSHGSAANTKPL